ncbi:MAG: protein-glutamate O-methyltransferase CheR [Deltaproteobacteria bacterium]|nr:protein-glutamate O-methyltransferase CheR [Deltaproteobacteria bacterium]MBW2660844.1 protein-glutamate O-methyltransferase CheR [Deltaproteobacteria bacterium]
MLSEISEKDFDLFSSLIKREVGISIRPGKRKMLGLKLFHRLQDLGFSSYFDYYCYILKPEGAKELQRLINIITIDQTSFFRGEKQFELLRERILPELVQRKTEKKRIRIWSSACSTGQEPYSLAMLVYEMDNVDISWDIKILATDANTYSLKIAYFGRYKSDQVVEVPSDYLIKYFHKEISESEEVFRIKKSLKERLIFRRLNLLVSINRLKGPIDLIFCRNVMIYFDSATKKKIIDQFYHLIEPGGYLCLGLSESLLGIDDRFILIERAIYCKKA